MGLLDWLTDIGGSSGSGVDLSTGMPMMPPNSGAPPSLPPGAAPIAPPPSTPPIPPSNPTAAGLPPPPGPLPAGEPVPFPNAGQLVPPPPPPASQPPPSMPPQASAPMSLAPTAPGPSTPPVAPPTIQGQTALGRALEIDPNSNSFKESMASLGAGLKSVGTNWNKPGLAAAAGSAGAAIEGGQAEAHKITDEQNKYLTQALAAQKAGDDAAYKVNYIKYLNSKADADAKTSKESVMNTQQQLYLRGLGAVANHPDIKASANALTALEREQGMDSPKVLAAMQAHQKLIDDTKKTIMSQLGIDEKGIASIEKQPGMVKENPIPKASVMTPEGFAAVKPGQWFINPATGTPLQKAAVQASPTGAPQVPTPAAAAPVPGANRALKTPTEVDAEEED